MHPLITDIQLFGEPVRPVVHDTVYIHILRDAVVVGLFDADFGSGEAVDGLPLGDVAQIFQLFAGNIQFFRTCGRVGCGEAGVLLDALEGIAEVEWLCSCRS